MATLQDRYSQMVDAKLRKELNLKDGVIFNNRYEGNPKAGAVKVRKTGAATIGDYNRATGAETSVDTDSYVTIAIDKDKYVNEVIDGYEASAVPDNMVADRLDSAGYGLALVIDSDGATELVTGGTALTDTTAYTKTGIYEKFVDVGTQLSNANVPKTGRWAIVTPETYALLLKSAEFIKASALGDAVVQTGAIGQIAGFTIFDSTNLGEKVEAVFGHPNYATRVNEWSIPVKLQNLDQSGKFIGASAVQGRYVYAHKVTAAEAILVKKTV